MNFGEKLKKLRKDKKMSQQAVADYVGVSLPTYRKWELNEKMPKKGEITKLCKKLDCEREELLDEVSVVDEAKEEIKEVVAPAEIMPVENPQVEEVPKEEIIQEETVKVEIPKEEKPVEEVVQTFEKPVEDVDKALLKHDKGKLRFFSRVLIIITAVMRVFVWIGIPLLLIMMFLLPIVSSRIDIHENYIGLTDTGEKIVVREEDGDMWLEDAHGKRIVINSQLESYVVSVVREFLKENSTERIVWHLEIELVLATISLAILYYIFRCMDKFFKNIYSIRIFAYDNQKYLGYCAWLILGLLILENIANGVFSNLLKTSFMPRINLFYIILTLSLFTMKYVFKYGFNKLKDQIDE